MMILLLSASVIVHARQTDTLRIHLTQLESIFLSRNLTLLAGHYNVDAQKAYAEQAKLWDNPVLVIDQNVYADHKFFFHGKDEAGNEKGEIFIQIQQLIKTAGKRRKLVDMANTNTRINELHLKDVLRSLRLQLTNSFYTLWQQLQQQQIYQQQSAQLLSLTVVMQAQLKAGNISEKDYLRIQALYISLQQDAATLNAAIANSQSEIRTLLRLDENSFIIPEADTASTTFQNADTDSLMAIAKQNNPYLLLQQAQLLYEQQNLSYQKALKVPDLTISPEYDKINSYTPNYFGLTLSMPIPLLNKNQGNIRAAGYQIKSRESLLQQSENEVYNQLSAAVYKLRQYEELDNNTAKAFYNTYATMYENVFRSFKQRQISLLEFLDFFNTYTDTKQKLLQQQLNIRLAKAELNYQTGMDVIK